MQTFLSGGKAIRIDSIVPQGAGPHPALMLLHGAGGNLSYWLDRIRDRVAQFGIAIFAPHYFDRTGTHRADAETILDGRHFPLWLSTARDAISYIAAQPGIDAGRIAALGISLGGYLLMALATEEPRLAAAVELSGGMPEGWVARAHSKMPPVLILHGDADRIVPVEEARRLKRTLEEAGAPHEMHILAGQGHWISGSGQMQALLLVAGFLERYLQAPRAI